MYNCISVGIDQSYTRTGIAAAGDGHLLSVSSVPFHVSRSHADIRRKLYETVCETVSRYQWDAVSVVCLCERVRLRSRGFLSLSYLVSTGALIAAVSDACEATEACCMSVDTRSWKSRVVGTCGKQENPYGVPPEKWPCCEMVIGMGFENDILIPVSGRKRNGTFERDGKTWMYDHDAADAAGIALYWFRGKRELLVRENNIAVPENNA